MYDIRIDIPPGTRSDIVRLLQASLDRATGLGDAGTADLFTEVSCAIDKQLWFVEAHLQSSD